jgi:hypothetical protein
MYTQVLVSRPKTPADETSHFPRSSAWSQTNKTKTNKQRKARQGGRHPPSHPAMEEEAGRWCPCGFFFPVPAGCATANCIRVILWRSFFPQCLAEKYAGWLRNARASLARTSLRNHHPATLPVAMRISEPAGVRFSATLGKNDIRGNTIVQCFSLGLG